MPKIVQVQVMDQRTGPGGHESCGYHTLKNSLLTLMHMQNLINDMQYSNMLKNNNLFKDIYNTTVYRHGNQDADVTLPLFRELLVKVKRGDFDFSAHGISKDDLQKLNLTSDGTQDITIANYILHMNGVGHGLGGMEDDLLVASRTAQIARSKGSINHVFALGINNEHWLTAAVTQNNQGQRTWQIMDSWNQYTIRQLLTKLKLF